MRRLELCTGRWLRLFCTDEMEEAEVELMEASMETCCRREGVNGSENGADGDEAEPRERDIRVGVCGDGDGTGGVAVVIIG